MVPPVMQFFREHCGDLFSQALKESRPGYLGQVEIDCKKVRGVFTVEVQGFPVAHFRMTSDEVQQWLSSTIPILIDADDSVVKLVADSENIVFKIYRASGYGKILVRFSYSEYLKKHRVKFHWSISYRKEVYSIGEAS